MNKKLTGVPASLFLADKEELKIDMNEVIGKKDIVFLCYDSLRYDTAILGEKRGLTPNINKYGKWEKRQAPGNFTYTSHHAIFAGFLPIPFESKNMFVNRLFFAKDIGTGRRGPKKSFEYEGQTIMEGLSNVGYETICIGGVNFFNKRTEMGKVFPSMFNQSYWSPKFASAVADSTEHQMDFALRKLKEYDRKKNIFIYINMTATHYPTFIYSEDNEAVEDTVETQLLALEYIDRQVKKLFEELENRNGGLVIAFSDHGSCFGEDGNMFHGINNEIVNTIPYMEFLI